MEVTCKNVYFVLFNLHGPSTRSPVLRRVLSQVVRIHELVWRTLGRFAQPAVTLIPPGVVGHDPGWRRASLTASQALESLRSAGLEPPIRLYAAVHPIFLDRYSSLLAALAESWAALGVDLDLRTPSMESYLRACADSTDLDLLIGRWIPDYEDPSTFTADLFHRRWGFHRTYFSSQQADQLLQQARQERDPEVRQQLYREFEQLLDQAHALLPLFHDVDYRIAQPTVRGLHLNPLLPHVQYARLGKAPDPGQRGTEPARTAGRGEIHVPSPHRIDALDPVGGQFFEHYELLANVFETLTRVEEDARVVPWLAASWSADPSGHLFRFELRPEVRFHDGRRLTARDVRYSFERMLRTPHPGLHPLLLPILGARQLRDGEASFLAGFRIVSATGFELELESPVAFFPAMLAHPGAAVVPEGSEDLYGSWRDGCSGTGPFRVLGLQPRSRLDLERNPRYWRPELPRSDRLTFHLGLPPEQIAQAFRAGQLSLGSDLLPADVEALRRDPEFAPCYRESPRLATYFLALNALHGPFADLGLRRALASALEVEALLHETAGRAMNQAWGILPPGLAGYEPPRPSAPRPDARAVADLAGLHLRVAVLPVLAGPYARFWRHLSRDLKDLDLILEPVPGTTLQVHRMTREGSVDLAMFRWVADYPDADAFAFALFHSEQGVLRGLCAGAEIDRLCEQGRRETDPALRHALYRQLEDLLRREARIIPLFHEPSYRFYHPRLRGLRFGMTLPEVRYEELYLVP